MASFGLAVLGWTLRPWSGIAGVTGNFARQIPQRKSNGH